MDYKFTRWSEWASIPIKFSQPIDLLAIAQFVQPKLVGPTHVTFPLGMVDTWNLAVGLEYQYNDRLALRFGLEDRPSSIPKEAESPLMPIASGIFYATGFNYKLDSRSEIDVGIAYFHAELDMPGGTSDMGNSTDPIKVIYNPFQGQDIKTSLDVVLFELSFTREF